MNQLTLTQSNTKLIQVINLKKSMDLFVGTVNHIKSTCSLFTAARRFFIHFNSHAQVKKLTLLYHPPISIIRLSKSIDHARNTKNSV